MDELISMLKSVNEKQFTTELKPQINQVLDLDEMRKRQEDFETKFREMQGDYRGENDFGTKPKEFHVPSPRKFWEFWK